MDVGYLDFHEAFDKVPRQSWIIKLKPYAIAEYMISWIQTRLTERRRRVVGEDIKLETSFEWNATGVGVGILTL